MSMYVNVSIPFYSELYSASVYRQHPVPVVHAPLPIATSSKSDADKSKEKKRFAKGPFAGCRLQVLEKLPHLQESKTGELSDGSQCKYVCKVGPPKSTKIDKLSMDKDKDHGMA